MEPGHGYVPVEKLITNFSSPGSGGGGGGVVGMGEGVGVGGASGCVGVGVGAGGTSVRGVAAASVGKTVTMHTQLSVCEIDNVYKLYILADMWITLAVNFVLLAWQAVSMGVRKGEAQIHNRFILQPMP